MIDLARNGTLYYRYLNFYQVAGSDRCLTNEGHFRRKFGGVIAGLTDNADGDSRKGSPSFYLIFGCTGAWACF